MNTTAPQELSDTDLTKLQGLYQAQFGITMNKQVILLFEAQKKASLEQMNILEKKQVDHTKMLHDNFERLYQKNEDKYNQQIKLLTDKIEADKIQHLNYTDAVQKATKVIESRKGQIVTDNPKVALWGNFSKYGFICLAFVIPAVMLINLAYSYYIQQAAYQRITKTLKDYPAIYKYQLLCREGTLVVNPSQAKFVGEFLALTIPKKDEKVKVGVNYYFDKTNDRILVPLSLDKNPAYVDTTGMDSP